MSMHRRDDWDIFAAVMNYPIRAIILTFLTYVSFFNTAFAQKSPTDQHFFPIRAESAAEIASDDTTGRASRRQARAEERKIVINPAIITGYLKGGAVDEQVASITRVFMQRLETESVTALKDLSATVPNFYIPDYGSKMTSSVYVRGLGARIDNPVVGMYVDGVSYLNKNNFDFDFFDIRSVDVLRGPQSTLFGRNTIGGLVNITTISPLAYQGTRASIGYGNGNTFSAQASHYRRINGSSGISFSGYYKSSDGFYKNEFSGENSDWYKGAGLRIRGQWVKSENLSFDNSFSISWVDQGGFPYGKVDTLTGNIQDVNYNDISGYSRFTLSEGLSYKRMLERYVLTGVTSYQYTDDCMDMDQDFTPDSYFTLRQSQNEHALSQDVVIKPKDENGNWRWLSGASAFFKYQKMDAPVTFKRDGIERLILAGANKGLSSVFPGEEILIEEESFVIGSLFKTSTYGAAIYHQSYLKRGKWLFEAGARLDYEGSGLDYNSNSVIHYLFTMTMSQYREIKSILKGNERLNYFEILPRLAASYNSGNMRLSASVARGYKAGGYNTQLFSDILQNQMRLDMMNDLGVHFTNSEYSSYSVADVITYRPEYCWNMEAGVNYSPENFNLELTLFDILCNDQQLTVFPAGSSTGRMMTNAGKTRSFGAEGTISYRKGNLRLSGEYGYTNARFIKYDNGHNDYSGKYVPYVPQHTVSAGSDYTIMAKRSSRIFDKVVLHLDVKGFGKIYWNESNTLHQPFYALLNGSVSIQKQKVSMEVWGKNITSSKYNTFYFLSMGNSFLQKGKPVQFGVSLKTNF
ncbi:MAG: TonB-dependent receptor [Bacteroidales bacterium]|nr:TonB-dependent receptor [Bacteroidales bacterium]